MAMKNETPDKILEMAKILSDAAGFLAAAHSQMLLKGPPTLSIQMGTRKKRAEEILSWARTVKTAQEDQLDKYDRAVKSAEQEADKVRGKLEKDSKKKRT